MDTEIKNILILVGFELNESNNFNGIIIPRDQLLSDTKYNEIKALIPELKKKYSSSLLTSLQKNADIIQKWPLLNFVRQILNTYGYKMEPIRKADGYTLDGIKKYKRYFQIKNKHEKNEENIKKIILETCELNEQNCEY